MISIIVPVYKAEKTIRKCLDSLISQTYNDWEALVVDDGSPDSSGIICDTYASIDSRFKIFHKSNGGANSARNIALDNIRGEYVTFCDSDDYVDPNWLKDFIDNIAGHDVVISGLNYLRDEDVSPFCIDSDATDAQTSADIMSESQSFGYLPCKCFRTSIIKDNDLHFNESYRFLEDEEFICRYWMYVERVKFIHSTQYNYNVPDFNCKYANIDNFNLYIDLLETASKFIDINSYSITLQKYTMGCFRTMLLSYQRKEYQMGWERLKQFALLSAKYHKHNKYLQVITGWNYVIWHPLLILYPLIKK